VISVADPEFPDLQKAGQGSTSWSR